MREGQLGETIAARTLRGPQNAAALGKRKRRKKRDKGRDLKGVTTCASARESFESDRLKERKTRTRNTETRRGERPSEKG